MTSKNTGLTLLEAHNCDRWAAKTLISSFYSTNKKKLNLTTQFNQNLTKLNVTLVWCEFCVTY